MIRCLFWMDDLRFHLWWSLIYVKDPWISTAENPLCGWCEWHQSPSLMSFLNEFCELNRCWDRSVSQCYGVNNAPTSKRGMQWKAIQNCSYFCWISWSLIIQLIRIDLQFILVHHHNLWINYGHHHGEFTMGSIIWYLLVSSLRLFMDKWSTTVSPQLSQRVDPETSDTIRSPACCSEQTVVLSFFRNRAHPPVRMAKDTDTYTYTKGVTIQLQFLYIYICIYIYI